MIAGVDPDFHRRDLANAIESGALPVWELGIQAFPDTDDQKYEGIDLLDPSKLVPEELAPVIAIGRMTLNANPTNYFAETEQIAFHPGHLVPGIDITDDPLLHARLFSYLDTQLSRLGGPNFNQIPINRPHAPLNDMLRDGMHQTADHAGVAPYKPNSLDGGCPFTAGADMAAYIEVPQRIARSTRVRESPASFDDHLSQARMFWVSMSPVEKDHIIEAFTFELGKCYESAIKSRELQVLADIDADLCSGVATGLGLPAPEATRRRAAVKPSPALSQLGKKWPTVGRTIGIIADEESDLASVRAVKDAISAAGMVALLIASHGGTLGSGSAELVIQRTFLTARSVEFDAIVVAGAPQSADYVTSTDDPKAAAPTSDSTPVDPRMVLMLAEAFRHAKAIGGWGQANRAFAAAGFEHTAPGVVLVQEPPQVLDQIVELLTEHRVWGRFPATP